MFDVDERCDCQEEGDEQEADGRDEQGVADNLREGACKEQKSEGKDHDSSTV